VAQSHVVPSGLKYALLKLSTGLHPWLQPAATPWLNHNMNSLITFQMEQTPGKSNPPNPSRLRGPGQAQWRVT
jgi:hypothetical protein